MAYNLVFKNQIIQKMIKRQKSGSLCDQNYFHLSKFRYRD